MTLQFTVAPLTWDQALESYWLARRRDFSPHTAMDYTNTFARFARHIGDRPVGKITSRDIHAFLDAMQAEHDLSRKTLSNYWTALSSFWTWAEVALGLPHIIRGYVPRPRYRRKPIRPYTFGEVRMLLNACEEISGRGVRARRPTAARDRAMIVTLVDTGIRCSELCALQIRDYDRYRRQLIIRHGKGDKERAVYLGQSAMEYIGCYLAGREKPKPAEWLFATRTGTAMERNSVRRLIMRLAEKVGVRSANVHRFRHTFAVNFLRNGGNVLALQELLGHENMATIRIYVRLAQADLQEAQRVASPADKWNLRADSHHGSHP